MKRIALVFLLILCSAGICLAQGYEDAIRQDPHRTDGAFYVYDSSSLPALTPVPAGYKPFYISHFARHGARCCTNEYDSVRVWFSKAAKAGVLTDAGKDFHSRYEQFFQKVRYREGNLTEVGKEQHRSIAANMYKRFPQVFKGRTHVEAVSTESARVIMSMWSCLSGLRSLDKSIDISADASGQYSPWLQPTLTANPYFRRGAIRIGRKGEEQLSEYFRQTVPWEDILRRFFTSPDVVKDILHTEPEQLVRYLHAVVAGTRCLEEDQGCFDDVFTPEEAFLVWKVASARTFMLTANYDGAESMCPNYAGFTLEQIIEAADADIASGGTQLRLRFGHDSGILPLLAMLDADGYGRTASTPEEAVEIFPNYEVPMGCSVQFVFYRKPGKDILVKVLLNEREVLLPLEPVQGTCYKWEEFKAHYLPIILAAKNRVIQ